MATPTNDPPGPPVVGIGASAGGLNALERFFSGVPKDAGIAYVVIVHLASDQQSHMAELIQRSSPIPVHQVSGVVALEPNHVYVIPPGHNLDTIDTHLRLSRLEPNRGDRAPIDHFLRTLASTHDSAAIGVVLTGTGSDGTLGIKAIKLAGGLTIAQDPNDAEFDGMPLSAIATGLVDLVLPLNGIFKGIASYLNTRPQIPTGDDLSKEAQPAELKEIFTAIRFHTGRNFNHYKPATLLRRIGHRMQIREIDSLRAYAELLHREDAELAALADEMLVVVTSFFRDAAAFSNLAGQVIPALFDRGDGKRPIRVWSVGCATGEEAYSIAILLQEEAAIRRDGRLLQIFATDLNTRSLRIARQGAYPDTISSDISDERLQRFFAHEGSEYRVRKDIRDLITFAEHNLLSDPPYSKLDLIICRNLMIYLKREVQREVAELFHYALNPGGYLMLGASESLDRSDLFKRANDDNALYRRNNAPARHPHLALQNAEPGAPGAPTFSTRPTILAYGTLHQKVVEQYAPPSVLVSPDDNIVHFSEHAWRYLHHPGGNPTSEVSKLVLEELRLELRATIGKARADHTLATSLPVQVVLDGQTRSVSLLVQPAMDHDDLGYLLVIFNEHADNATTLDSESSSKALASELTITRGRLQSIVNEYEIGQAQLKAGYDELQSANEELRSTMEELETSREELQSMNEELSTVNEENRSKVEELSRLTADLNNLLTATSIATLFLDRTLHIQRFTPALAQLFNIRAADGGRPLSDLTHRLGDHSLIADAKQVLDTLMPLERELRDESGRWHLTRLVPYRNTEDGIDGVVVTLVDITARKQAEEALVELNASLEARVSERTSQVRALARSLTMAEQAERARISQILHDDLQQLLHGVAMKIQILKEDVGGEREEVAAQLDDTLGWVERGIDTLAGLTTDLSPPILAGEGLADALRWLQDQMRQLHGLEVTLEAPHSFRLADREIGLLLLQIIRELLFNVKKHAQTDHAALRLDQPDSGMIEIQISDDGIGFKPAEVAERAAADRGFGLVSARERIALIGGSLDVDSRPGKGTRIVLRAPATIV